MFQVIQGHSVSTILPLSAKTLGSFMTFQLSCMVHCVFAFFFWKLNVLIALAWCSVCTELIRKETKLRGKYWTVRRELSGMCTDQWWVNVCVSKCWTKSVEEQCSYSLFFFRVILCCSRVFEVVPSQRNDITVLKPPWVNGIASVLEELLASHKTETHILKIIYHSFP